MVKASLFAVGGGPSKLIASAPEVLCPLEDFVLHVGQCIATVENPFSEEEIPDSNMGEEDVDFTRIEDFFSLETKIDAKNDHTLLKVALASKSGSFMYGILNSFNLPLERLAFIQQQRTNQMVNSPCHQTLVVSGVGGIGQDSKDFVISCQVCGEMFNEISRFQRHILTHPDPEAKKFLCQFCGKRFNRADHLNRHAVLHGEVVHKCLLCGEEFDRASHLDRHRRKNHPPAGQAPSQTPPLTPQEHTPPINLYLDSPLLGTNLHLLAAVATPENTQQVNEDQVLQHLDTVQVFSQILKSEMDKQQVSGNTKPSENIERPFICDVCGRKFIRSTHLRRHTRIHTGEKPFSCHICGRRYARGDYLRAHINAHRRDRVHKCKHCNEIFHDLMRFADHCRAVHRDVEEDYGTIQEPPITPNDSQVESFTIYEDISLSTLSSEGKHYSEHVPMVSMATSVKVHEKEDVAMTTFTSRDLTNPFQGTDFLQFVSCPSGAQTDSHVMLQNGSLSYHDSEHEITVMSRNKLGAPPLLDPLAHLIIQNTEPFVVTPTSYISHTH